jgi:molecular chaperone DnaJ
MAKRDYYEVLGVDRSADQAQIKKAYRKLALELHPDRNPGDPSAEERFKEASEAFSVLGDPEKRAIYDRYGHAGLQQGGVQPGFTSVDDIFSSFHEIFGDLFGFAGDFGGRRRSDRPSRGADLQTEIVLTLAEACSGCQKEVTIQSPSPCEACHGTGAEGGRLSVCATCHGAGQVAHARGAFRISTTCPACHGAGRVAQQSCRSCGGRGEVRVERKVRVAIPAGIDDGQSLRLAGQGQRGQRGGPPGDLYVTVRIKPDPRFVRDGIDLVHDLHVSFTQAALGATVKVPAIDGEVEVKLPAGVQPGEQVRVKGRGVPRLGGPGRGDLVCVIHVDVPKQLSAKARRLLLELQETFEREG